LKREDVGSDFEVVEARWLQKTPGPPPWLPPGGDDVGVHYLQSGRQALAAVAEHLGRSGRDRLVLPGRFCDTMLTPFVQLGWRADLLPLGADLAVAPEALSHALQFEPERSVVLHAPYFGAPSSPEVVKALTTAVDAGVVVVADETHIYLSGPTAPAHFRMASLRKTLPIPDGGYLIGDVGHIFDDSDADVSAVRWRAMNEKSRFIRGEPEGQHRALFAEAEYLTHTSVRPTSMSSCSRDLIARFDYDAMAERRRANARALVQQLDSDYRPLWPSLADGTDWTPSHVVVSGSDIAGLRSHLVKHRIFCPVHWPPSEIVQPLTGWPSRYLSIPIDHRYDDADMRRVADVVNAYVPGA
jgi:hypothetical protein